MDSEIRLETLAPALPARDVPALAEWYRRLGFETLVVFGDEYAIVGRWGAEIHFFVHPELDPKLNDHGCYLRVRGVDALYREYREAGVERMTELEDRSWGMKEFAVIDPEGNLLRIGEILPRAS